MLSTVYYPIKKVLNTLFTFSYTKDYDFNEPVDKSNKNFWVGSRIVIDNEEYILHKKTNLIMSFDGELVGRYTSRGIIEVDYLEPKIIQWYNDCGFNTPYKV